MAFILEGVTIAQPFSPLLARYGITSRDQLPPHGHGLGACDLTIASGRIARIAPAAAAPAPEPAALPASYAEVPLAAPPAAAPAPAPAAAAPEQPRRIPMHNCFAWPGLLDSSTHSIPGILDTSGAGRRAVGLLNLLHGVTAVRETGVASEAAAAEEALGVALGRQPAAPRRFWVGRPLGGSGAAAGEGGGSPSLLPRWVKHSVATERAASQAAASAALGCCGLEVASSASLEALEAARACALAHGLPLLGHVPHATPYGACGLAELLHLSGLPPLPCAAWAPCSSSSSSTTTGTTTTASAFEGWLGTWQGGEEGISASQAHCQAVAQVLRRENMVLTPCLARYWAGGLCADAASQRASDVEEGGSASSASSATLRATLPPPHLPVSGGLPPPRLALAHARAWNPEYMCACMWGDGGGAAGSSSSSAVWATAGRLLTASYLPALPLTTARAMQAALPGMVKAVGALHAAGCCIHAGSGALSHWATPGLALHAELLLLKAAGLSDEEALCAATVLPGAYLASQGNFSAGGAAAAAAAAAVGAGAPAVGAADGGGEVGMLPPPLDHMAPPPPPAVVEEAAAAAATPADTPATPEVMGERLARLRTSRLAWLGFVCEGAMADLVVSRVNPKGDLEGALDSIVAVVVAGKLHYCSEMEEALGVAQGGKDDNIASTLVRSALGNAAGQLISHLGGLWGGK